MKDDVTIVFDGTIRSHLKSSGIKIASRFTGNVSVLVLASRLKADEAVLDAATYPDVFAISNDGIKNFPEKPAVREGRIFRHEVRNDRIRVGELDVERDFEMARTASSVEFRHVHDV